MNFQELLTRLSASCFAADRPDYDWKTLRLFPETRLDLVLIVRLAAALILCIVGALVHSTVLRYNRVKTKTPMSVEVLDSAQEMLDQLRNRQSPRPGCPDYLFGILHGDKKRKDERAYREYQSALRRFNYCLKSLAKRLRLNFPVTSYTLRHSWATTAKYRGVPIEMISESLGHKSIKTTQIYLKGFELKERTEVNRMNLSYVKRCGVGQCI